MTNQRLAENLRFWLKYFELGFPIDAQAKDGLTRDIVKCLSVVEDKAVGSAIDELERAIKAQETSLTLSSTRGQDSMMARHRVGFGWEHFVDGKWVTANTPSGGYDPLTRKHVKPEGASGAANLQSPPVRHTGPVGECQDGPRKPSPYVWTDPDKTPVDSGQWTGRETTWDPGIPRRHPVDERHVDPTTANNIEQQERRVDRATLDRPGRVLTPEQYNSGVVETGKEDPREFDKPNPIARDAYHPHAQNERWGQ